MDVFFSTHVRIMPMSQMSTLRLRGVKGLAQGALAVQAVPHTPEAVPQLT